MTSMPPESHFEFKNMLWLEVTNFCNLNCSHCYNESGPERAIEPLISPARYRDILVEARQMGFVRVQFIGGEPMFYPHLKELVEHSCLVGFQEIEIFSNLTTAPAWLLSPAFRHVRVAFSFYSDDAAVHDAISQTPGSFARTVATLRKVVAAGLDVRAGYIEMLANTGHYERARAYLRTLGIYEVGFDAVREFGREGRGEPSMSNLCGQCSAGNLSIDVEGNVSGCIMSKPWAFGNVNKVGLDDLFHSPNRREFVRELKRNVQERKPIDPVVMCVPYDRGDCAPQCAPSCYPSQGCNPCSPHGGQPCNPNGDCNPYRK
jgi:MoaA/NifB/PqqE/SkfB family radical SAM enzyme